VTKPDPALAYADAAEKAAAAIPDIPAATPKRPIARVGVLGAGTMGSGIAMSAMDAGFSVTLVEADGKALERGLGQIRANYEGMVGRGRIDPAERDRRLGRIVSSLRLADFRDCDLVIEAVFEDLDLKKKIFRQLAGICRAGAILATNTSSLDIDAIAAVIDRSQDVIGLHFFSPANVMKVVEIVRPKAAAADTVATSLAFTGALRKVGVVVGVCPGFVANRSRAPLVREAHFLVEDGALPWQVDRVLKDFGMAMGPFAVGDLAGLDVSYRIRKSQAALRDPADRYPHLADHMVESGRLGRKSGKGWYRYEGDGRSPLADPEVERIVAEFRKTRGITARPVPDSEILERCLFAAINEGAHILDEGKALRASDIDVLWLLGFGFPRSRGGIMYTADRIGLATVYERVLAFEREHGKLWRPAAGLERRARAGQDFIQD
jgi:3-hydroxyacyl-CoA dehydrogenase